MKLSRQERTLQSQINSKLAKLRNREYWAGKTAEERRAITRNATLARAATSTRK